MLLEKPNVQWIDLPDSLWDINDDWLDFHKLTI